ncbi:MAG: arginine--tRNA ligase, partial [Cytophagales bacterium]
MLTKQLISLLQKAIQECYGQHISVNEIHLSPVLKNLEGSHAVVLFPMAQRLKTSATSLGNRIGSWILVESDIVKSYQVIGGFLNLTLKDSAWLKALSSYKKRNLRVASPEKILAEISCPNTNKPWHLGHVRNTCVGDAVANLLGAVGHEVKKVMHINDRGVHICKSILAYQHDVDASTPDEANKKGDHFVGDYYVKFNAQYQKELAELPVEQRSSREATRNLPSMVAIQAMLRDWEAGDEGVRALWSRMNDWVLAGFKATADKLGFTFDLVYRESATYLRGKEMVLAGLKAGVFYQKEDQSIWVDLEKEGFGQKLLLRGDGTTVYMTQDIGTAAIREEEWHANRSIYVVGNEQEYHFKVLFATLKKLGCPYANTLEHLSYGMVELPSGKMKSREGTIVDADNLIDKMRCIAHKKMMSLGKVASLPKEKITELQDQIAIGALKFFLLKVAPSKTIVFDPEKSIDFQGNTGSFIQYTHARIVSLLKKAPSPISFSTSDCPYHLTASLEEIER